MSASELLLDLGRLGVRLEVDGERLRFHPRSTVSPDLLSRLKTHKAELLAMLRPTPEATPAPPVATPDVATPDVENAFSDWVLRPDANGRIGLEAPSLPEVDRWWATSPWEGVPRAPDAPATKPHCSDGWPPNTIVPPEGCKQCGSLDQWQSMAGDWHCSICEPPTKSRAWLERAAKLREQAPRIARNARPAPSMTQSPSEVPTRQNGV